MRGGRREEREVGDRAGGGSRREFRLRGGRLHGLGGCREADRREKRGVRERNFGKRGIRRASDLGKEGVAVDLEEG